MKIIQFCGLVGMAAMGEAIVGAWLTGATFAWVLCAVMVTAVITFALRPLLTENAPQTFAELGRTFRPAYGAPRAIPTGAEYAEFEGIAGLRSGATCSNCGARPTSAMSFGGVAQPPFTAPSGHTVSPTGRLVCLVPAEDGSAPMRVHGPGDFDG